MRVPRIWSERRGLATEVVAPAGAGAAAYLRDTAPPCSVLGAGGDCGRGGARREPGAIPGVVPCLSRRNAMEERPPGRCNHPDDRRSPSLVILSAACHPERSVSS